jgi:hypothetical protein
MPAADDRLRTTTDEPPTNNDGRTAFERRRSSRAPARRLVDADGRQSGAVMDSGRGPN